MLCGSSTGQFQPDFLPTPVSWCQRESDKVMTRNVDNSDAVEIRAIHLCTPFLIRNSMIPLLPLSPHFSRASLGEFDAVVSLYHDQGHIAAKMLDFHGTVSMNPGLPFLRTSVDHGTAFDIAGKGIAREDSMVAAIRLALAKAEIYRKNFESLSENVSKNHDAGMGKCGDG